MVRSLGLLLEMLAIVYGIATFFGKRVKYNIKTVSFITSEVLLTTLINEYDIPVYLKSLSYIIIFIYGLMEYGEGVKETVLDCLLTIGIISILQQIFYYIIFFFLPQNNELQNILWINSLCFAVLWGLVHYKYLNKFYEAIIKNRKICIGILLFVCICLLADILEAKEQSYLLEKDTLQLLYFTGLIAVVIGEWQKARVETEREKAEFELNKLYYAAYEELVMLIRDRQHDIKNHINAIYSMIYTTNNYEDLVARQKQYCDFVLESGKETQILLAADNPLIAGFLYQKEQEAKQQHIRVEYRMQKIISPLLVSEYELIEMLGILLDNAIEALIISDLEQKKIIVGYSREEQWDVFRIANTSQPYSEEEMIQFFQRNYSSKGLGRGIGLDKIRRKLKQLNGGIKVENMSENQEMYLEFSIMLPGE